MRGSKTQNFVFQKWPKSIFPLVNSIAFGKELQGGTLVICSPSIRHLLHGSPCPLSPNDHPTMAEGSMGVIRGHPKTAIILLTGGAPYRGRSWKIRDRTWDPVWGSMQKKKSETGFG